MNWSDERYVRLYTRDTPDWMIWPWQSRALFPLLMRKADRAGIVVLGKHGMRGLSVLVGLPAEVVEAGLAALLDDGCVVQSGDTLAIRNYIAAQECPASDRARAKASRERRSAAVTENADSDDRRDAASRNVTAPSRNVTECHEPSRRVTDRHDASHGVTPYCAVPYRAVPEEQEHLAAVAAASVPRLVFEDATERAPQTVTSPPTPTVANGPQAALPLAIAPPPMSPPVPMRLEANAAVPREPSSATARRAPVLEPAPVDPNSERERAITAVLVRWRERSGLKGSIEGPKARNRRRRIAARFRDGFTLEDLLLVSDGAVRDGFLMGTEPGSKPGGFREVDTWFRDPEQCERLIALANGTAPATKPAATAAPDPFANAPRPKPYVAPTLTPEQREEGIKAMRANLPDFMRSAS